MHLGEGEGGGEYEQTLERILKELITMLLTTRKNNRIETEGGS